MAEYPCGKCQTEVADNDNSVLRDLYDNWHHTICADVSNGNYEKLKVDPTHGFPQRVLTKYPSLP